MSHSNRRVMGIDVGGTSVRVAVFEQLDQGIVPVARVRCATDPTAPLHAIHEALTRLASDGVTLDVVHCGIGLPEYVHHGEIRSSMVVNFGPDDVSQLTHTLRGFGATAVIRVESDVRCAALAEWRACEDPQVSVLYISVGTGLSSALVLPGGELWEGVSGGAISLGEWLPHSDVPGSTAEITLEQYVSGRGMETRYEQMTGVKRTAQQLTAQAAHDPISAQMVQSAGHRLGQAVWQLTAVLDPHLVIVGGGLGAADTMYWDAFYPPTQRPIQGRDVTTVQQARLGQSSGEYGAALIGIRD